MFGRAAVEEISLDDGAVPAILWMMFQQQGVQLRQSVVRHEREKMMRQVIIHAQRETCPADQPADQEHTSIAEAIAAGVAVLHDLASDHAKSEARHDRQQ